MKAQYKAFVEIILQLKYYIKHVLTSVIRYIYYKAQPVHKHNIFFGIN